MEKSGSKQQQKHHNTGTPATAGTQSNISRTLTAGTSTTWGELANDWDASRAEMPAKQEREQQQERLLEKTRRSTNEGKADRKAQTKEKEVRGKSMFVR